MPLTSPSAAGCALRVQHKKSQSYVGERLGVSYQQIHKYETGETQISPSQLLIYAKLFNVNMAYLYGITGQSNNDFNIMAEIESLPSGIRIVIFELVRQVKKCEKQKKI